MSNFTRGRINSMKKAILWGFTLLVSLVILGTCKNSSEPPRWWANSTWKYDGETDDRIILGENRLTYYSQREEKMKNLAVTVTETSTGEIENKTKNNVSKDERILAWIIDENKGKLSIYAIIYCPISFYPDETWKDEEPQKLKILDPAIHADIKIKFPFNYIRQKQ